MKKYSKIQIYNAIQYWKNQLNENYQYNQKSLKDISIDELRAEIKSFDAVVEKDKSGNYILTIDNIDISILDCYYNREWIQQTLDYIDKFNFKFNSNIDIALIDGIKSNGIKLVVFSDNEESLYRFCYGYMYNKLK